MKFYITFPFDYKMGDNIEVEADNSLDAYCKLSATVWPEKDWKETITMLPQYDKPPIRSIA